MLFHSHNHTGRLAGRSSLPDTGFARLTDVLRYIPVSRSCFLDMVNRGEFARPVKLTARVTAWRVEDIRAFIDSRSGTAVSTSVQPLVEQSNSSASGILVGEAL